MLTDIDDGGSQQLSEMPTDRLTVAEMADFYESSGQEIFAYLCVLCRNEDDAADLLQSTFAKFIEVVKAGKIRRTTALRYVKVMAKNNFIARYRQAGREVDLPDDLADDQARRQREETSREIQTVLLETLDSEELTPEMAEILRLRFVEHHSVEDLCNQVEQSRATVYRLMSRGIQILARAFERAGLQVSELDN